jgi:hypothetical protein
MPDTTNMALRTISALTLPALGSSKNPPTSEPRIAPATFSE